MYILIGIEDNGGSIRMQMPRLRRTIEVSLSTSSIHFYASTRHLEKSFERDPVLEQFLMLLNGTRDIPELLRDLKAVAPEVTVADMEGVLAVLAEEDLIEDAAASAFAGGLTTAELHHFDRQIAYLEESSTREAAMVGQQQLRQAHVTIFGVGGLGSWVATLLAMAGVGHITVCDADVVDDTNLTRQGAYRFTDIGRPKVEALADYLIGLSPGISVNPVRVAITATTDLRPYLQDATFAASCMDEPSTAVAGLWVSQVAVPLRIPHQIGGGYNGHLGLVGPTVIPGKTGCWHCFLTSQAERDRQVLEIPGLQQRTGTVGPITSLVASLHAWEILRIITGTAAPLMLNRTLELDLNTLGWHSFDFERVPGCPICGSVAD